jgi:isopenicillin N synthase-like dioxygenase
VLAIPTLTLSLTLTLTLTPQAAQSLGFFHITNHGLPSDLRTLHDTALLDFFRMPVATKATCSRARTNSRGWSNTELTKNIIDAKELFDYGSAQGPAGSKAQCSPSQPWIPSPGCCWDSGCCVTSSVRRQSS